MDTFFISFNKSKKNIIIYLKKSLNRELIIFVHLKLKKRKIAKLRKIILKEDFILMKNILMKIMKEYIYFLL